ncbi:MAG: quinone-dependent dihydroorotate dehydrogenase [Salinisphaeraceae bacterium]|nr:quinone-dependent dihydroorotate dehydrogenase [Salinisphaeraceae bacterium]
MIGRKLLYPVSKSALFCLDAETAHELTITMLSRLPRLSGVMMGGQWSAPRKVMGLEFPNPVGLAAGLDKNGECIEAWHRLGFGFIEVGTVTPRPQPGNPKPRMFRLPKQQALINRLGFNNKGVDYLLKRVKQAQYNGILGINIGKNFDTPLEDALDDYIACMRKVYSHASYITANVSSPNTQGLRELQKGDALRPLLLGLKAEQAKLSDEYGFYVPLVIKIAPDMEQAQIQATADILREYQVDGVIATNTTISRPGLENDKLAEQQGGLSGKPLLGLSNWALSVLSKQLAGEIPIIGLGGITDQAGATAKLAAGADLLQIYTGFIYRGPELIRECVAAANES